MAKPLRARLPTASPVETDLFLESQLNDVINAHKALLIAWNDGAQLAATDADGALSSTERFLAIKDRAQSIVRKALEIASVARSLDSESFDTAIAIAEKWCSLAAYSGSYLSFSGAPSDDRHQGSESIRDSRRVKIVGTVVKAAMQKTVKVAVQTSKLHPVYGKRISQTKHFLVHDEYGDCIVGDVILARQCRPLSKLKRYSFVAKIRDAKLGGDRK